MSLLDILYGQPVRGATPGRIETPLGPWPATVSPEKSEAQRQRAIEAAANRRNKNKGNSK